MWRPFNHNLKPHKTLKKEKNKDGVKISKITPKISGKATGHRHKR